MIPLTGKETFDKSLIDISSIPSSRQQMTWREFMNSCSSSADFYAKLAGVFIDTSLALSSVFLTGNWHNLQELEKKWL